MSTTQKPFALGMATEGEQLQIVALQAGRTLDKRLTDLGLNIGSEIRVVQRQGAGMLVERDATRIAVGGGMAMKIMVVHIGDDG
ncbi:iron transporter FeoA [Achromatium sp. WMS3]|nr:iron transporter FeoA [Achromatium sp. WMS3]